VWCGFACKVGCSLGSGVEKVKMDYLKMKQFPKFKYFNLI